MRPHSHEVPRDVNFIIYQSPQGPMLTTVCMSVCSALLLIVGTCITKVKCMFVHTLYLFTVLFISCCSAIFNKQRSPFLSVRRSPLWCFLVPMLGTCLYMHTPDCNMYRSTCKSLTVHIHSCLHMHKIIWLLCLTKFSSIGECVCVVCMHTIVCVYFP